MWVLVLALDALLLYLLYTITESLSSIAVMTRKCVQGNDLKLAKGKLYLKTAGLALTILTMLVIILSEVYL